jgi:arginyl-tRNA synthetase
MFDLLSDLGRRAADALRQLRYCKNCDQVEPQHEGGKCLFEATMFKWDDTFPNEIPGELPVVVAGRPEFGDYQISACLQLGKSLKRQPRQLAETVAAALTGHPALTKVEVAGAGFVNLHLADSYLAEQVSARMDDARLGLRPVGRGTRVVIDYSAPNVAKPMHIGHIRSTIVGDAIARTLRALDHDVIADNHLGDWGTQFGKLIVAYRRWLDPAAYDQDAVAELLRLYTRFVAEEKAERAALGGQVPGAQGAQNAPATEAGEDEDEAETEGQAPPILEEARRELVKLQAGDPENRALWRKFIADSRHAFESIYDRLGVKFDYWLGESSYNELLPTVIRELERRGIVQDSRGAKVVFFSEAEKMPPFIVQKSDGGFNYATTDIATVALRVGLFGAARIIVVTDERQQLHFRQLFAVARRLGVEVPLEHAWFGLMRLPEGTIQTRAGNVIHLSDLLDEAERRAYVVAGEHNPELDEKERREVARVVGLGAVKYNDLSKDRQTLVTFTFDKALSLQGNTAPYLQYAYARVRSIIRKGGEEPRRAEVVLGTPVERALAKRILGYPEVVEQVGRTARPHFLCDYLYELATAFSGFYADHPVLKAEPAVRASRLVLTELVARILQHGLNLLGIEVLERM